MKRTKKQQNENARRYIRTPSGRLNFIYRKQITRSKERGFPPPEYSFKELKEKYINDPDYIRIHEEWAKANYIKQLVPSIDRIDSTKPYTFSNIQMMTWADNRIKQSQIDIHNSHDTPVAALIGDVVRMIFKSQAEAALITGAKLISRCIRTIPKKKQNLTSGGYAWKSLRGITPEQFEELKSTLPILFSQIKITPKPHRRNSKAN